MDLSEYQTIIDRQWKEEQDKETPTEFVLYKSLLMHLPIHFALGSPLDDPHDPQRLFIAIYALARSGTLIPIGLYLIRKDLYPDMIDDTTHQVDLSKWKDPPSFFKQVYWNNWKPLDAAFVKQYLFHPTQEGGGGKKKKRIAFRQDMEWNEKDSQKDDKKEESNQQEEEEEDGLFRLKKKKTMDTDLAVFTKNTREHLLPPLSPQTEEDMEKQKKDFKELSKTQREKLSWVNHFLHDTDFSIDISPQNKHSFLHAIQQAFVDKGWITSVDTLCQVWAKEVTKDIWESEVTLFYSLQEAFQHLAEDKTIVETRLATLHTLLKQTTLTLPDKTLLQEEWDRIQTTLDSLSKQQTMLMSTIQQWLPHMSQNSMNMESYRDTIRQGKHPITPSSIELLERLLRFKTILLHHGMYPGAHDFVVNMITSYDKGRPDSNPLFFLLVEYEPTTHQYRLVRYKERGILPFVQLPYSIQARLTMRSLENPRFDPLASCKDFLEWKEKQGFDVSETSSLNPLEEVLGDASVADGQVRLLVDAHAPVDCPVESGLLDVEHIPLKRWVDFLQLNQMPTDWRRRLADDDMTCIFRLDDHVWQSVTHFLMAAPYRDAEPKEDSNAFFRQFTRGKEYSKEANEKYVEMARQAGQGNGKKAKELRPNTIPRRILDEESRLTHRLRAWEAKVTQNEDVHRILQETKDATLYLFERGQPLRPDTLLMNLRGNISQKID